MIADAETRAELEEEREFLLRSLRDLEREHDAGDIDDDDYVTLKDDYTARAAAVLRSLDAGAAAAAVTKPLVAPGDKPAGRSRTAVIVAGVILFAVVAGLSVASLAGLRQPGKTATGGTASDSNTLLAEARSLIGTDPINAIKRFDEVLKTQPDNVEALAYRGWLVVQASRAVTPPDDQLLARGEASIDRAIAVNAKYADAHFFKAWVLMRVHNNPTDAITEIDTFNTLNPPAEMKSLLDGLRAEAVAAKSGAPTTAAATPAGS